MNYYFNQFGNCIYHSICPLKAPKQNENTPHAYFNFQYFSSINNFSLTFVGKQVVRIWRALSIFTHWNFKLAVKIMACFGCVQKEPSFPEYISQEERQKNLEELFNLSDEEEIEDLSTPLVYEQFRDQVLTNEKVFTDAKNHKTHELMFNFYYLDSYLQLKNYNPTLLTQETQALNSPLTEEAKKLQQKEQDFKASRATYEAIVDLYVQRFLHQYPKMNHKRYLHSLRTVALTIAIKAACDQPICNSNFMPFLPTSLGIKTYHRMEREFLKAIDWNTSISELCVDL